MRILENSPFSQVFFFICLVFFPQPGWTSSTYANELTTNTFEIIKIRHRPAKELLPQVETMLSANGRASADTISNSIIISDTSDNVVHVKQLINDLDIPVPQVTINLRSRQATAQTRSLSTTGGIHAGRGGLEMSSGKFNRNQNFQLTVSSGSSGYLLTGRDIPFTNYWLDICHRYGYRFSWLTDYKRIESGFEVTPVVLGNRIDLLMLPRLSFGDGRSISFAEAATRMTVPVNTWVTFAATDTGMQSVSAAILTAKGQTNNQAMTLEVKAHVR